MKEAQYKKHTYCMIPLAWHSRTGKHTLWQQVSNQQLLYLEITNKEKIDWEGM